MELLNHVFLKQAVVLVIEDKINHFLTKIITEDNKTNIETEG